MPAENETVFRISTPGANEAIAVFEKLAEARARAAGAGGGDAFGSYGGGSVAASPAPFGGAPPAPGTLGSTYQAGGAQGIQEGLAQGMNGGGGQGGYSSYASITINANHVVIYASSMATVSPLAAPNYAGGQASQPPSGTLAMAPTPFGTAPNPTQGAPAAPGTGSPALNQGTVPPWGGGSQWANILGSAIQSPSVGGAFQTVVGGAMEMMPYLGTAFLVNQFAQQVVGANFAKETPRYQTETGLAVNRASGMYMTPSQQSDMLRLSDYRGQTAYERDWADFWGHLTFGWSKLGYETGTGRERDRIASIREANIGKNVAYERWSAVSGDPIERFTDLPDRLKIELERDKSRQKRFTPGSKMWGWLQTDIIDLEAKIRQNPDKLGEFYPEDFELGMAGMRYGDGGLAVAKSMWDDLNRTARINKDPAGTTRYEQSILGFGGSRIGYGYLPQIMSGHADLAQMEQDMIRAAAAQGDLDVLQQGRMTRPNANWSGAFNTARQSILNQFEGRMSGLGIDTNRANVALLGVTGFSSSMRAGLMRQADTDHLNLTRSLESQLRLAEAAGDKERAAELRAQVFQSRVSREQNLLGADSLEYQGRLSTLGSERIGVATAMQSAMFGSDPNAVAASYSADLSLASAEGGVYERMSRNPRLSPEDRLHYAALAGQKSTEVSFGIPRAAGQYAQGMEMGRIGLASSQVSGMRAWAGFYGSPEDAYRASMGEAGILDRQAGVLRGDLHGAYGPRTQQERLEIEKRLTDVMREHAMAVEGASRSYYGAQTALSSMTQSITGAVASNAFKIGVGGSGAAGFLGGSLDAAQGTLGAARQELANLEQSVRAAGGNPDRNDAVLAARQRVAQAEGGVINAGLSYASAPMSASMREEQAQAQFSVGVLGRFPGTYGSVRAGLMKQMGIYEHEAGEVDQLEKSLIAKKGSLTDEEKYQFNQRRRSLAMEQAGVFEQLSYGWESRLQSQMLGAPGSMAFINPALSFRAAIGAGVRNPHMGATGEDMPMFLRQAMLASSIAGSTGTPQGFGVTALTGARIVLDVPLPGGGRHSIPARIVENSNEVGTPGAQVEMFRRMPGLSQ